MGREGRDASGDVGFAEACSTSATTCDKNSSHWEGWQVRSEAVTYNLASSSSNRTSRGN